MLKDFTTALTRSIFLLLGVYVPTLILVYALILSATNTGTNQPLPLQNVLPLTILLSLFFALLMMASIGGRSLTVVALKTASLKHLGFSLVIGAVLALVFRWLFVRFASPPPVIESLKGWQIIFLLWISSPLELEVIFRGLFQGIFQESYPQVIQLERWKLSVAALVSAIVFAIYQGFLLGNRAPLGTVNLIVIGSLLVGLIAGQFRFRTDSLLPGILIHFLFNVIALFPLMLI